MTFAKIKPTKGTLLIAEPFLGDPGFERTVVLITDHHKDGTVGFVLNKQLELKVEHVLSDFPDFKPNLFYGGPVQQNNLYYIHSKGEMIPESVPIGNDLWWGGKVSAVKEMLESGLLNDGDIRFFLGYSGWGKDQLEEEINDRSWLVVRPKINFLSIEPKTLWKKLLLELGGDYLLWANSPSDPILN